MELQPGGIIGWIIVGLVAGWLAGKLTGSRMGCLGDLVLGLVGAFIGGLIFSVLGIHGSSGLIGSIAVATVGAIVLIFIGRLISPRHPVV